MKIEQQSIPALSYLGKSKEIAIDTLMQNSIFKDTYGALGKYMGESEQKPTGPAVAIYRKWDPENNKTNLMPAFQVAADAEAGEFELLSIPAGEAYVGTYEGPYAGLKEAHEAVMAKMAEDGVEPKMTVEEYTVPPRTPENDPECEKMDDSGCVTRLVYYF